MAPKVSMHIASDDEFEELGVGALVVGEERMIEGGLSGVRGTGGASAQVVVGLMLVGTIVCSVCGCSCVWARVLRAVAWILCSPSSSCRQSTRARSLADTGSK